MRPLAYLPALLAKPNGFALRLCLLLAFLVAGLPASASASSSLAAHVEPEIASASLTQHNGAVGLAFPREGIAQPAIETRKKKLKLSIGTPGGDGVNSEEPEACFLPHLARLNLPVADARAQDTSHFWRSRAPPRLS